MQRKASYRKGPIYYVYAQVYMLLCNKTYVDA